MSSVPTPGPAAAPRRTVIGVAFVALLAFAVLALQGPIAQPAAYHLFADTRAWLGVPNAADVLSNLPFALVGLWGLRALVRVARGWPTRRAWAMLCIALVATAAGSAWYHWVPDDQRLVLDRIPIAWACAAVLAAFCSERLGWSAAARPPLLAAALVGATLSVLWWWWTGREGVGDLRAYLVVQGLPMLVVPTALLLGAPRRSDRVAPDSAWWGVLLAYALAKAAEIADQAVFAATGALSGHTLKHLLAAAGAAWLLRGAIGAASARSDSRR